MDSPQQVDSYNSPFMHMGRSAVEAIDAAIASLHIREHVDNMVNGLFEHMGNLIGAGVDKAKGAFSGGASFIAGKIDGIGTNPSASVTPNISEVKKAMVPERTPEISLNVQQMARNSIGTPSYAVQDMTSANISPLSTPNLRMGVQAAGMAA